MPPIALLHHDVNPDHVTNIDWGKYEAAPVRIHFDGGDALILTGEEAVFARKSRPSPIPAPTTATVSAPIEVSPAVAEPVGHVVAPAGVGSVADPAPLPTASPTAAKVYGG